MSAGPKHRRGWYLAGLAAFVLLLGIWWSVPGPSTRGGITGTWSRESAPGTRHTVILRPDGTTSSIQVTTAQGIPSPQQTERRWLVQDGIIFVFSQVPWWCEDWMLELYLLLGQAAQDEAEIVSVTENQLVLRPRTGTKEVVFQRDQ
jgi:hypothetical protein